MTRAMLPALALMLLAGVARPCTIISGRTDDNVVWVANNEDYFFDFDTYLNVLPGQSPFLGVLTFTYDRPGSFIQGGLNEAGLFLDFNALPPAPLSAYRGWEEKKDFPGGERALVLQALRTCPTVPDVLKLLERYRLPGLLGGQMHVADRQGNLAIVNADSVCMARGAWQVSTNFNVCTGRATPEAASCWRFPIAERTLAARGVGLDGFRVAAMATRQPRAVSTIYTTIVNLTAGDFYLYYGGDYENPYRVQVKDLLAKGKRSYPMRSLFPDAPVTRVWDGYRASGAEEAVWQSQRLALAGVAPERRAEILRYVFLACLFTRNQYADASTLFDEWLRASSGRDPATSFFEALVRLAGGDYTGALASLARQVEADSASAEPARRAYLPGEHALLARLRGTKPPGANVRFELKGCPEAKFVGVYGVALSPLHSPLLRAAEGWAGDFALPPGRHHYGFVIDGKLYRDPANARHEIVEGDDQPRDLSVKVVP